MTCGETSGFLFHHDCGREADAACNLCGKAICRMHARAADAQLFCVTCLRRYMEGRPELSRGPGAPEQALDQQAPADQAVRRSYSSSRWYTYDDPYWYTDRHCAYYHEHDLTARDRQAFEPTPAPTPAGTEESFETDKEAS